MSSDLGCVINIFDLKIFEIDGRLVTFPHGYLWNSPKRL